MIKKFIPLLLFPLLFLGCSTSRPLNHPTAYSALWVQNSAEFNAITRLVYRTAASNLALATEDSYWTAAAEQEEPFFKLPPAVILDVDETVLDNSPFQARMIKRNSGFNPEEWTKWVSEADADAVEGALDFTRTAAEKGVTVFYVTNREHAVEEFTFENLEKLGFPLSDSLDVILSKNERDSWTSDKSSRRKYVARDYRILMLFGDDLNDFVSAKDISSEKRAEIVENNRAKWGREWYILPNPNYGSWEQALYDFNDSLSEKEKKKRMESRLNINDRQQ